MAISVDRLDKHWLIRLEGECTVPCAAELKRFLLEWLASGRDLQLDLERAEEIDITVMQLIWAAGREAARVGSGIVSRVPEVVAMAVQGAGFELFPGAALQE